MPVNDIVAEEQRDLVARLLDGDALHFGHVRRTDEIDEAADLAVAHGAGGIAGGDGTGQRRAPGQHVELPGLLLDRHGGDQRVDIGQGACLPS